MSEIDRQIESLQKQDGSNLVCIGGLLLINVVLALLLCSVATDLKQAERKIERLEESVFSSSNSGRTNK